VHNHYSSWRDPTDPIYMMFWNGAVFLNALAYAVEDSVVDPQTVRHKNLFSAWAIVRWWLTGALHGFLITFALVLAFEVQPPRELGVRFMCVSSVVLSARLAFITNRWLAWEDVAAANGAGAPLLVRWILRALHTKAGHWVPCFFFTYCQTRWSGIATIPVVVLAVGVAALCVLTDCLIFPRWGPVRYAIESTCALMLSPSRRILQRVGGGKPPVELQKISAKKQ
jgi:magnesium-transporting ATPase (P-type)